MTQPKPMTTLPCFQDWLMRIYTDLSGQDMIEYALMASVVALASAAASPQITSSFSTIFSRINSAVIAQGGG